MNDSREHILTTSLKLFLQKSFKEVTMKEIVAYTGLSKGAFYHYFSSKEQVFSEVIHHFFREYIQDDFSRLPQDSLGAFYQSILTDLDRRNQESPLTLNGENGEDEVFNINHYYLLFDAVRMLPEFKQKQLEHQQEELATWTNVIATARRKGEIQSVMTDEQLAKLFIYLGDGVGINFILTDGLAQVKEELRVMWDGVYALIKT